MTKFSKNLLLGMVLVSLVACGGKKETGEEKEVTTPTVDVIGVGAVEARANKKDEALKLMKNLIEETKQNYVVEIVKEVTEGQKYAGYGVYTPSKSAKLGKFVFFSTQE